LPIVVVIGVNVARADGAGVAKGELMIEAMMLPIPLWVDVVTIRVPAPVPAVLLKGGKAVIAIFVLGEGLESAGEGALPPPAGEALPPPWLFELEPPPVLLPPLLPPLGGAEIDATVAGSGGGAGVGE
jgi:hypothetical protein